MILLKLPSDTTLSLPAVLPASLLLSGLLLPLLPSAFQALGPASCIHAAVRLESCHPFEQLQEQAVKATCHGCCQHCFPIWPSPWSRCSSGALCVLLAIQHMTGDAATLAHGTDACCTPPGSSTTASQNTPVTQTHRCCLLRHIHAWTASLPVH